MGITQPKVQKEPYGGKRKQRERERKSDDDSSDRKRVRKEADDKDKEKDKSDKASGVKRKSLSGAAWSALQKKAKDELPHICPFWLLTACRFGSKQCEKQHKRCPEVNAFVQATEGLSWQ